MYPNVMMRGDFCYGKYEIEEDVKIITENGFYKITYESNLSIPILPHHSDYYGLCFPNGAYIQGFF